MQVTHRFEHHNFGVSHVMFSPDDQLVCTSSWDNTAVLCPLWSDQGNITLSGHRNPITCADFNGRNQLATSSWDKTIRLWDIERGVSCPMTGHGDVVWSVTFNPASPNVLASVSRDLTTALWDTRMAGRVTCLSDVPVHMNCVKFSPDGTKLVSGGSNSTILLRESFNVVSSSF